MVLFVPKKKTAHILGGGEEKVVFGEGFHSVLYSFALTVKINC